MVSTVSLNLSLSKKNHDSLWKKEITNSLTATTSEISIQTTMPQCFDFPRQACFTFYANKRIQNNVETQSFGLSETETEKMLQLQ